MNATASNSLAFNKNNDVSTKVTTTKTSKSTSTKLKRKLISMRRSSTVQTLLPVESLATKLAEPNSDCGETNKKSKQFKNF